MKRLRAFGIIAGALLAMLFMAGGAYAHGSGPNISRAAQAAHQDRGAITASSEIGQKGTAWIVAADQSPPATECAGGMSGNCCSQHCCLGPVGEAKGSQPTQAMGLPLALKPPETPCDQILSRLLRPPCN